MTDTVPSLAPTPVRTAVGRAAEVLDAAGVPSPAYDAAELTAHALGVPRSRLPLAPFLDPAAVDRLAVLVRRRAARVPLQHLTGRAGFRHLDLAVGPGAFVPRPETEVVVGWLVDHLRDSPAPRVVDLCAGPGTIAFALAQELPRATVHAVELDPAALTWARRNAAERAAAGDRPVVLHLGDAATALPALDGTVDAVISNPPYIPLSDRDAMEPEVRDHDPYGALFAGADGLSVIRQVEASAARLLRPGGVAVVEHADRQGRSAPAVFHPARWSDVEDHRDLAGRDRFLTATRRLP